MYVKVTATAHAQKCAGDKCKMSVSSSIGKIFRLATEGERAQLAYLVGQMHKNFTIILPVLTVWILGMSLPFGK